MMTKNELIAQLRKLHNEEEVAIPIYTKHLESTLFLSHIKSGVRREIEEMLLTLAMESEVHAKMFEAAIKKIQDSKLDVY
jgi:hypothetical protein